MVMPAEEKWFHDVIEHVLLTEFQLPVFPIKYRWFNKMNTESLTLPPSLAWDIREETCCRVGDGTVMAHTVGGIGVKAGVRLPARPNRWGASCWHLDLANGQGERLGFLGYDPSESAGESGCEHYENQPGHFEKRCEVFVGFWVESNVAEPVCWPGRWGCWVLGMVLISTTKYAGQINTCEQTSDEAVTENIFVFIERKKKKR